MDAKADLEKRALDYHAYPSPGKVSVVPTKPLANQTICPSPILPRGIRLHNHTQPR